MRSRRLQAGHLEDGPLRSALWIAAGLAAVVLLCRWHLSYEDKLAPLIHSGVLKQRTAARNFAVTVDGYRLAQSYTVADTQPVQSPATVTLKTPGVWLSVVATVEALQEPGYVSARLRTRDGLYYAANDDTRPRAPGVNLSNKIINTALPQTGAYFFELPPAQVPGAHVQFYWGTLTPPGMDSLLDVDLATGQMTVQNVQASTAANVDLRP